jgi:hypothetical protein
MEEKSMKSIESAVEKALHYSVKKSRPSVSFEQAWDKYANQKSGASRRLNRRNFIIAASAFTLMLFVAYQSPVMAYVEQFLKVKIIAKEEKAKFEGDWGGAANMSVVASEEEAEKLLGMLVPWPTINKDAVNLIAVAHEKGYNFSFSLGDGSYYLWARYKEEAPPEFYAETAGTASEKGITVQGVAAKLITSSDFPGYQIVYFEKDGWKFMISVLSRPGRDEQALTKALLTVAESIR